MQLIAIAAAAFSGGGAGERPFNSGWRFFRGGGDFADPAFDDSAWRVVDTPHDWSSEDLPPRERDKIGRAHV